MIRCYTGQAQRNRKRSARHLKAKKGAHCIFLIIKIFDVWMIIDGLYYDVIWKGQITCLSIFSVDLHDMDSLLAKLKDDSKDEADEDEEVK